MSHYLVTGGAGFIGSTLAKRLLADGHQVRILDDLSTGRRELIPAEAQLIEADIRNLDAIRLAFEGIDGVFHCAALARVPFSIEYPALTNAINIDGTLNVLLAARDAKVKRVVYSASSSAYGVQASMPLHPDMAPNPLNPYALQKYVGELYAKQFNTFYGLETVSLRYFNVYGPNMAEDGAYVTVISVFKQQAAAGKSLTVEGDGEQTRDFTHVFDVVDANVRAMTSDKVGKGEVLNIGAGERHSVNAVAKAFNLPVDHLPPRRGDTPHTLADISRTTELLGWVPKIKFEEGLTALLKEWNVK
jgi:nucleoside-diphosphate-sugar epimerase